MLPVGMFIAPVTDTNACFAWKVDAWFRKRTKKLTAQLKRSSPAFPNRADKLRCWPKKYRGPPVARECERHDDDLPRPRSAAADRSSRTAVVTGWLNRKQEFKYDFSVTMV